MKKIRNKIAGLISALILLSSLYISCGEEKIFLTDIQPASGTKVKLVHAASEGLEIVPSKVAKFIRSVDFYIDENKISGTSIVYGSAFPVTDYAVLNTSNSLKVVAPFTGATQSIQELTEMPLVSGNLGITGDGFFTIAVFGPSANREFVIFQDALNQTPYDGQAYVRLMNLIPNSNNKLTLVVTPPKAADGTQPPNITIAQNIGFKEVSSGFVVLTPGTYTNVQVKDAVNGTVLGTLSPANSNFAGNRVYTIYGRGQLGLTSTDTKRALFDRMINR